MKNPVLHDFDRPYPNRRVALRRGIQLILYALSHRLRFLQRLSIVQGVYWENYEYCIFLAALDRMLGIRSLWGLHLDVQEAFPELRSHLEAVGFQVHDHWHVSESDVRWDPPLPVPRDFWWFDREYAAGKRCLKPGDWILWHVDHPELLKDYVRCLNEADL